MLFRKSTAASFILTSTALLLILVFGQGIAAGTTLKETPLNEAGRAYELFRAGNGELWISDWLAGEMWRVNPNTNAYTIYEGLLGASDGRLDSSGDLWWSNLDDSQLGHLVPGANTATLWPLPPGSSPIGLAFDAGGNVWVTASTASFVYRFVPGTQELCSFPLPDDGAADYLLFHNGTIWLGDWILGRILRLNPTSGAFTIWQLSDGAYPRGLSFDANDRIWWADYSLAELGQLDPQSNGVTTYLVPGDNPLPVQLSILEGEVWYSDEDGSVGALDPAVAVGSSDLVSPSTMTVSPTCQTVTGSKQAVTMRSGTAVWSAANFTLTQPGTGWMTYQLSAGAAPFGIAANGGNVWFTDQGDDAGQRTQQLGWLELAAPLTCYQLTRNFTGPGSAPTAIPTNSSGCALGEYVAGENINLTAHPNPGAGVASWSGTNNNSSTASSNSTTMPSASHTVTVNYKERTGAWLFLPSVIRSK